jgi:uncharacterized protein HemX
MTRRREGDPESIDATPMRRNNSSGPWWQRWGLLGVLVLGIVGVSSGIIPSAVSQTKEKAEQIQRELDEHKKTQEALNERIDRRLEQQLEVLREMCVGLAQDAESRRRCIR